MITIYHNPRCSKSRAALAALEAAEIPHRNRLYLQEPLSANEIAELLAVLVDPVEDAVRQDAKFAELGLTAADIATADDVARVLTAHPDLLQRPILLRDNQAIIARDPERLSAFVAE